jgi:Tol biopolymer transport system component
MEKGIVAWSPTGDRLLFSGCLDYQDHDVYVVDVHTGVMTNLTPKSRAHDFSPMWTMDGSKIVFLSTNSSSPYRCSPDRDVALPQIKLVNVDGRDERIVYDPEFYYPYWQVSVSNDGQIAIFTDMISGTYEDYKDSSEGGLYSIDLREGTDAQMRASRYDYLIVLPIWSPSEEYMAYRRGSYLKILSVETGEEFVPLEKLSVETGFVWSPDSQKIAVVVSTQQDMAIDSEEHIHVFDLQSQTFQPLIQEQTSP